MPVEWADATAAGVCAMQQRRAKIVRHVAPESIIEMNDVVKLMTREQFEVLKAQVLPTLRARGDPPPRVMEPGKGDHTRWFSNLKHLLECTPGGVLVRGYKLFVFPLDARVWCNVAWRAHFHLVVARESESGKFLYECPNSGHNSLEAQTPFIFVPSSRAHLDVSDEDILANKFVMGEVVGGNPEFTDVLVMDRRLRGRRASVIATCPEECVAKRNVVVRLLPYFREWFKKRDVKDTLLNLGERMGMPCCNVGEDEHFLEEKLDELMERMQSNGEALVNGAEGIKMEFDASCDIFTRKATIDEVKLAFFEYYDKTKIKVDEVSRHRLDACLRSQRLN